MGSSALSKTGFLGFSPLQWLLLCARAPLVEETPLAQAQGWDGSLADLPPDVELGAALQKAPWQEGAGSWGTGANHRPAFQAPRATLAPPAHELTPRDARNLESFFRHWLPAPAGLQGDWGGEGSVQCEMSPFGHVFPVHPTQAEPQHCLPTPSTQHHFSFTPVLSSPQLQTLSRSRCKPSRAPAWRPAMLEGSQQTQCFGHVSGSDPLGT